MKKSLLVMLLAVLQCACSGQPAAPEYGNSLISFAVIASEISVSHQETSAKSAAEKTVTPSLSESL